MGGMDGEPGMAEGLETVSIGITGMTCDRCVRRVDKALRAVSGVREVSVTRQSASATVTFETAETNLPALQAQISKSGYQVIA
jgi:P-type Cu+ transporter